MDEIRVRVRPTREQVPAGAQRAEAPERTVYHNSAMSNESGWLPARACDPFNFLLEEKAFPCRRLTVSTAIWTTELRSRAPPSPLAWNQSMLKLHFAILYVTSFVT